MFKIIECWWEEIKCNNKINQGYSLSHTAFYVHVDMLEEFLEDAGCVDQKITNIIITLLLCIDNIVLLGKGHCNLSKSLIIFQ